MNCPRCRERKEETAAFDLNKKDADSRTDNVVKMNYLYEIMMLHELRYAFIVTQITQFKS